MVLFLQRFTVSLHNPSGGAVLGAETSVIVKILKNDSPKGLFGFLYTQVGSTLFLEFLSGTTVQIQLYYFNSG